jgi:hypothetical protein
MIQPCRFSSSIKANKQQDILFGSAKRRARAIAHPNSPVYQARRIHSTSISTAEDLIVYILSIYRVNAERMTGHEGLERTEGEGSEIEH